MALSSLVSSGMLLRSLCRLTLPRLSAVAPSRVSFCASTAARAQKEWIEVTYEKADGTTYTVQGKEGDNLLDVAINNDLDLDGFGACEGTLACSTCHLVFKKEDFDNIEEICTDEELDMLDLAYGLTDEDVSLSLSGSGFLGVYQLGALECLHHHTPKLVQNASVAGASAGALLAACVVCGVPLGIVKSSFVETALAAQHWAMGPFNPNFKVEDYLKLGLETLPHDAHLRANGRLFISVTRVKDLKNEIVSHWDSREELVQCLLCSCFLPIFSGVIFPVFRGEKYIDGGFTNNLPIMQEPSITISPFEGIVDICPKSVKSKPWYVKVANEELALTVTNMSRFVRALLPPTAEGLENLHHAGYNDAFNFIKKKKS